MNLQLLKYPHAHARALRKKIDSRDYFCDFFIEKVCAVFTLMALFVDLPDFSPYWANGGGGKGRSIERSIVRYVAKSFSSHNALSFGIYTSVFTKLHMYISNIAAKWVSRVYLCLGMCVYM